MSKKIRASPRMNALKSRYQNQEVKKKERNKTMIDIHRDIQRVNLAIGCADKTGKLLADQIMKGKYEIEYKKALVEMLLQYGLLPMPLVGKPIYITDKRGTDDNALYVSCQFIKGVKSITELSKVLSHPLAPYLNLTLTIRPETALATYKFCLKCEQENDTKYSLLSTIEDPVIVVYRN